MILYLSVSIWRKGSANNWINTSWDVWASGWKGSGVISGGWPIARGVLQGSILGPVLLNILINDFNMQIKGTARKFYDDSKLEEAADPLEGRENLQRDPKSLRAGQSLTIWSLTKASQFPAFTAAHAYFSPGVEFCLCFDWIVSGFCQCFSITTDDPLNRSLYFQR